MYAMAIRSRLPAATVIKKSPKSLDLTALIAIGPRQILSNLGRMRVAHGVLKSRRDLLKAPSSRSLDCRFLILCNQPAVAMRRRTRLAGVKLALLPRGSTTQGTSHGKYLLETESVPHRLLCYSVRPPLIARSNPGACSVYFFASLIFFHLNF